MSKKDDKFDRWDDGDDEGTYKPRTGKNKSKKVHRPSSDTQKPVSKRSETPKKEFKEKDSNAFKENEGKAPKKYSDKRKDEGRPQFDKRKDEGFKERKHFDKKKPLLRRGGNDPDKSPDKKVFGKKRFERDEESQGTKGFGKRKDFGSSKKSFKDDPKRSKLLKRSKGKGPKRGKDAKESSANIPEYDFKKINKFKQGYQDKKGNMATDEIRLNRYVANAGVCSRREADDLIAQGLIKVNGTVVTQLGTKVKRSDEVSYKGEVLSRERKVYVLLNKPRNHLTTMDDPEGRRTVMDLVGHACEERIYPVGRLDRNTTGLLLFTNDGELATTLAHPSSKVKKVYRVELTKPLDPMHFEQLSKGIELEDGFMKPDNIAINELDPRVVGVEIHSGRNRIVRRMFEHFGYEVDRLDRTAYAGLTKKDIPRGKWRFLNQSELIRLKHFEKFKG